MQRTPPRQPEFLRQRPKHRLDRASAFAWDSHRLNVGPNLLFNLWPMLTFDRRRRKHLAVLSTERVKGINGCLKGPHELVSERIEPRFYGGDRRMCIKGRNI
ncbi:unnamed protein product [Ixodes persulcatus]